MRLYLSSYKLGIKPEEMLPLIEGDKKTAIIMNAQDSALPERRTLRLQEEIESLKSLGLHPKELDLRNYFDNNDALVRVVEEFDYIWVRGGNVFLLRRAFKQSGFDEIITKMLKNDEIAYGGFSAGICILSPTLEGAEIVDPKDEVAEGYDNRIIWDGLNLLNYAVAPHYMSDHPESTDVNKYVEYLKSNNMAYKTLRDGEAIVINGDSTKSITL